MSADSLRDQVRRYYDSKLEAHGATPRGVDWNSAESQELRFRQLARLFADEPDASLLDYGCGYGALADYVRAHGHAGPYVGFDVSAAMVETAARLHAGVPGCRFTSSRAALAPADYVAASGIFNVRLDRTIAEWEAYVHETLADMASLAVRGFAFNVLTAYSDADRQRPDLYYADPRALLDYCIRTFSRRVSVLHDYPLYEFTMLVRQ